MEMELALRRNDHKFGWQVATYPYLIDRANQEIRELLQALHTKSTPDKIVREAADAANFLMMVADNYGEG